MAACRAKITGNKARGYQAECSCGWMNLGTYILNRAKMEIEVKRHYVQMERTVVFSDLEAKNIDVETYKARMLDIENRLAEIEGEQ